MFAIESVYSSHEILLIVVVYSSIIQHTRACERFGSVCTLVSKTILVFLTSVSSELVIRPPGSSDLS